MKNLKKYKKKYKKVQKIKSSAVELETVLKTKVNDVCVGVCVAGRRQAVHRARQTRYLGRPWTRELRLIISKHQSPSADTINKCLQKLTTALCDKVKYPLRDCSR